jgi:hypothetical protein
MNLPNVSVAHRMLKFTNNRLESFIILQTVKRRRPVERDNERYSPTFLQHQCLRRLRDVQSMLEKLEVPETEEALRIALRPVILTMEEAEQFLSLICEERVILERSYGFLSDSRRILIDDEKSLRNLMLRVNDRAKGFEKNPVWILAYAFKQYCLLHNKYLASLETHGLNITKQDMGDLPYNG